METEIGVINAKYLKEGDAEFAEAYAVSVSERHYAVNESKAEIIRRDNQDIWIVTIRPISKDVADKLKDPAIEYGGCHWEFVFNDNTTWCTKNRAHTSVHRGYKDATLKITIPYDHLEEK